MKSRIFMILLIIISMSVIVGCAFEEMPETIPTEIENYTVKFMVNGKKYDTMSFEEDGKIKFPEDPYMEGYEFVGWYTEDDEPIEKKFKVTENLTLYAKFVEIEESKTQLETYTISFYVDGVLVNETECEEGYVNVALYYPTVPTGTYFLGWYTKDGSLVNSSYYITSDIKVYASFELHSDIQPVQSYIVTYYIDNKYYISEVYMEGSFLQLYSEPTSTETKKFIGWFDMYDNQYFGGEIVYQNLDLYAKFEDIVREDFTYNEFVDGIEITGYTGNSDYVEIPTQIKGKAVISIGKNAFENCTFKELYIPSVIMYIGVDCLKGCNNLEKLTTPYYYGKTDCVNYLFQFFDSNSNAENINYPDSFKELYINYSDCGLGYYLQYAPIEKLTLYYVNSIDYCSFDNVNNLKTLILSGHMSSFSSDAYIPDYTNVFVEQYFNCDFSLDNIKGNKYLYSEMQPESEGNYWHYVDGNPVIWEELLYNEYDDYVEITGYRGSSSDVVIPEYINNKPVTIIGFDAFRENATLQSVILPQHLTKIDIQAFYECKSLTSVDLSNCTNLTEICNSAFESCTNLSSIKFPSSLTTIGGYAFYFCTYLPGNILDDCTNLEVIGEFAFAYCKRFTKLHLGSTVKSMSSTSFISCDISNLSVDENNPVYDSRNKCNAIIETATNTLILGNGTSFINEGITSIADYAFSRVTMSRITIPSTVTSIGNYAFKVWDKINNVYFLGTEEQWNNIVIGPNNEQLLNANIIFEPNHEHNYSYYTYEYRGTCLEDDRIREYCKCGLYIEEIILAEDKTTGHRYHNNVCEHCGLEYFTDGLIFENGAVTGYVGTSTYIEIPSNYSGTTIYSINAGAFANCTYIRDVRLSSTIKYIWNGAFSNCTSLKSVILSKDLLFINQNAFSGCTSLETVYMENNIQTIHEGAFANCNIQTIYFYGNEAEWNSLLENSPGASDLANVNVVFEGNY